ncbi:hypothetical protein K2X89_15875 [Myxococcota bacterium]|nr:hypothetical protein [Myxococcota bacterium]
MRLGGFQAGLLLTVLAAGSFAWLEGKTIGKQFGRVEEDPILVFVVPEVDSARRVRAAVAPEAVVWEGDAGFALASGRVVALSAERAGEIITGAGWVDREIQIVSLEADPTEPATAEPGDPASHEATREGLRALVNKPTLSYGEQVFVLQAMMDGIEP